MNFYLLNFLLAPSPQLRAAVDATLQAIRATMTGRHFEGLLDRIEALPLPTIAAIHGGVYGGATDLALCCDLRVGVHTSRMFMPPPPGFS